MKNSSPPPAALNQDTKAGLALALMTYTMWGILPLYLKQVSHFPMLEVVAHRVIWSVPIALVVLIALKRTAELRTALKSPKLLAMGVLCAAFISSNWGIYVWAISVDRLSDAALGYYINPLFSVLMGAIFLREQLKPLQWVSIVLMGGAVALLTWETGSLPMISIGLALTWGFYALFKRMLPLGPNQGFALEVIILLPFACVLWFWYLQTGDNHFLSGSITDTLLLMGLGLMTACPLILYANAAKRMRLSSIALMQYLTPSLLFIFATVIYKEPISQTKMMAFGLIWLAIAVYISPFFFKSKAEKAL